MHDRGVDLVTEDLDLAIRFDGQTEPGWGARRLAGMPMFICASPEYLRAHGRPRTLEDLADHLCPQHLPAKTCVFLDFLVEAMAEHPSALKPRARQR